MVFSEQYFFILMSPTLWQPTLGYQLLHFKEAKKAEMLVHSDKEVRTVKTGVCTLGCGRAQNFTGTGKAHHVVSE